MPLERRLLQTFETVARLGSVGAAAREMNVPQPTLSRQLRSLERQLGHILLDRDSRGTHLTEAGRDLLPRVRLILHEMDQVSELMDAHAGLKRGTLRVGAVAAVARGFLSEILAQIALSTSSLTIEVLVASEDQLEQALAQRDVDIILATDPPTATEAVPIGSRLIEDRCRPFCARNHPLLRHDEIGLAAVLAECWAMPDREAKPRKQFEQVVRAAGGQFPEIVLQTDSPDTMLAIIMRSKVLGWLPEPMLETAAQLGKIVILDIPELSFQRRFQAYRRARGTFPSSGQIFLDAWHELAIAQNR